MELVVGVAADVTRGIDPLHQVSCRITTRHILGFGIGFRDEASHLVVVVSPDLLCGTLRILLMSAKESSEIL